MTFSQERIMSHTVKEIDRDRYIWLGRTVSLLRKEEEE